MRLLLLSFILFPFAVAHSQPRSQTIHDELLQMLERDQAARIECANGTAEVQIACLAKVAERIDQPNTRRLNEIFNERGFPSSTFIGADGVQAFFLLLQHSGDVALKNKCKKGVERAYKERILSAMEFANFVDGLLVNQGKLQIYGSNFAMIDGKMVMNPTADVENLDKRRNKIGLPPMAEYVKMLKDFYKLDVVTHE